MYHHFHYIPEYIQSASDTKDFWVSLISALATLLAVGVALFQEKIRSYFTTSKLDMQINLQPPDCHQIALTDIAGREFSKCIYIRIRVTHRSGESAQNVQVLLTNLIEINKDGNKTPVSNFLPMNLVWSHFQPRTYTIGIPKRIFRHCDLGCFVPQTPHPIRNQNGAVLKEAGDVVMRLDTIVQPNVITEGKISNVLSPGKYELETLLTGDNVSPLIQKWKIEFNGIWNTDETVMLKDNIKIESIQ